MSESRERKVQSILHAYLQAVDRGEKPERQAILDEHPELREELAEFFADASKLENLAASLKTASFGGDGGALIESPSLGKIRYFGDYELLEEISRGGMGVVYKATQVSLNRVVALKMILKGEFASETDVRRFRQEAESAANLDHPNIVPIYEVGEHEGQQYFSMKLISIGASGPWQTATNDGQTRVAATVAKVARAVHHAHQRGILHRDLKPSNILLDRNGEPHVADFGLAKKVEGGEDATKSGAIVGTPAYMAPEQARAEKSLTTAVDVWSLGAILYEWLTGVSPFRGDDPVSTLMRVVTEEPAKPRTLNATLDRDLETICLKCLEREPANRYGSAEALADDLDRWMRGEPIVARPTGRPERVWRWCRRNPMTASLIGSILVLLCAATIGSTVAAVRIAAARDAAQSAEKREGDERKKAEGHADDAKKRLARQYVGNAARAMEEGDHFAALPWLVEALRQDIEQPEREKMQRLRLGMVLQECPKVAQIWNPPGEIIDLAFVGERLRAVAVNGQTVQVWDALTGEPLSAPLQHDWAPTSAGFRGDGKRLVTGGGSKPSGLVVWDLPSAKKVCTLEGAEHHAVKIQGTFTPDGKRILVQRHWHQNPYFYGGEAGIWDAETGQRLGPLHGIYGTSDGWLAGNFGGTAILSKDGKRVAHLSGGSFWVWDAQTGERITPKDVPDTQGPPQPNHVSGALHADFSPDGSKIVVGYGADHPLHAAAVAVYDATSGKRIGPTLKTPASIVQVAFSASGKKIHVVAADCSRWVWDGQEADASQSFREGAKHELPPSLPSLSPNGIHAAVVRRHQVFVWNMANQSAATPVLRHEGDVRFAVFDEEGCRLATVGKNLPLRVFDFGGALPTFPGREYAALPQIRGGHSSLGFSPDGKRAVLRSWTDAVQLWDLDNEKPLAPAQTVPAMDYASDFDADHPIAYEARPATKDRTELRLYHAANGKVTRVLVPKGPKGENARGTVTPNGRWLITDSLKAGTQFWDSTTGELLATFATTRTERIKCSPDSRTLVGLDKNGDSRAWEIPSGKVLWSQPKSRSGWTDFEFSPDSASIAVMRTHQKQNWLEMIDSKTAKPLFEPIQLARPLVLFDVSRDGKRLLTVDEGKMCRLWDARTGVPLGPEWKSDLHSSAIFSEDGSKVFLSSYEFLGRAWDPVQAKPFGPPIVAINSWRVSPDARMVFATSHPQLKTGIELRSGQLRSQLLETETGLPLTPQLLDNPSNYFLYHRDGKRLLFLMNAILHKRELLVEERTPEELATLVLALSRHHIDQSESLVMADGDTYEKAWRTVKAKHWPRDLAYTPRQRHEWHVQAAIDCLEAILWDGARHRDGAAWGGALHHLHYALQAQPDSAILHLLRAQAWQEAGENKKALADLDKAAVLEPRCGNVWEERAWLHVRLENLPQAAADLAKVIDLGAGDIRAWQHLAVLHLHAGKPDEYRALCDKMLDQLRPEGPLNRDEVLLVCALHPKGPDARRLLALSRGEANSVTSEFVKALAHRRAGEHAEAADLLDRYVKDSADLLVSGTDLAQAALIYHHAGRKKDSETWRRRLDAWRDKEGKDAAWVDRTQVDLLRRELEP